VSISNIHFDCAGVLLRQNLCSPSIELVFSFNRTCVLLRLYFRSPSIVLRLSFDFTEKLSPQRFSAEPSPSQRRALVIATASLRQLVESSARRKPIQRNASVYPKIYFRQSPEAPLWLPRGGGEEKPMPSLMASILLSPLPPVPIYKEGRQMLFRDEIHDELGIGNTRCFHLLQVVGKEIGHIVFCEGLTIELHDGLTVFPHMNGNSLIIAGCFT